MQGLGITIYYIHQLCCLNVTIKTQLRFKVNLPFCCSFTIENYKTLIENEPCQEKKYELSLQSAQYPYKSSNHLSLH